MAQQLPLDLRSRPALGRAAYLVSQANAQALEMVENWALWPGQKLVLAGPPGAGKTHLAHVWAAQSDAMILQASNLRPEALNATCLVIEDVDRILGDRAAEEQIFHLHNAVLARSGALLVTGISSPHYWDFALPDLASRLRAAGLATLDPPDEALLSGLMVKLFADRGVRVPATLVSYLLPRIERSFEVVQTTVDTLCVTALAEGCPVGRGLAVRLFGD